MARRSAEGTDLDQGLQYFSSSVVNKLIKGRKTDYISIIACHSPNTNNPFSDSDGFGGIDVVCNKTVPTYDQLKAYKKVLVPNPQSSQQQGDCLQAMLVAVGLMQTDLKLKFIRNIVVITNGEDQVNSFDTPLAESSVTVINDNDINVQVIGIGFDTSNLSQVKLANKVHWQHLIDKYKTASFIDAGKIPNILQFMPPLKRIKPIKSFDGQLRLGGDISKVDDSTSPVYFNVEVYPAVRTEKLANTHQYFVKSDNIAKVTSLVNHYILVSNDTDNSNDDGEVVKINVNKENMIPGFKYSNYDLISMDDRLQESSTLPVVKSMDIVGFIKNHDLPVAYYTSEANYVVCKDLTKDMIGYSSFCQALIELQVLALVRYVAKNNSEVLLCALLPTKVKIESQAVYVLQMVRLPYKEDEKIGRFPNLIKRQNSLEYNGEDNAQETAEIDLLMDEFVLAKDLDVTKVKPEIYPQEGVVIDNNKTPLTANQSITDDYQPPIRIESKLLLHSPALRKFNNGIVRIIDKSLELNNLNDFLNDPQFITKYMTTKHSNLFNLNNVARKLDPDSWLSDKNAKAYNSARKLTKIVKPYRQKVVKPTEETNSFKVRTAKGVIDVENDEPLDIEDLLK